MKPKKVHRYGPLQSKRLMMFCHISCHDLTKVTLLCSQWQARRVVFRDVIRNAALNRIEIEDVVDDVL
ncbi:hypothetical protein D3C86_2112350 [compost metagenome]